MLPGLSAVSVIGRFWPFAYNVSMSVKHDDEWDAARIRALRQHMGLSQQQLSDKLGVRQQTVSEWETGMYRPRGGMCTLLSMVAERVGFLGERAEQAPRDHESWLHQPLTRLELKPRALKALHQAGVRDVGAVLACWQQGPEMLLEIPGFGRRSLDALAQALRARGLIY